MKCLYYIILYAYIIFQKFLPFYLMSKPVLAAEASLKSLKIKFAHVLLMEHGFILRLRLYQVFEVC